MLSKALKNGRTILVTMSDGENELMERAQCYSVV